jgi:hypothetical protein
MNQTAEKVDKDWSPPFNLWSGYAAEKWKELRGRVKNSKHKFSISMINLVRRSSQEIGDYIWILSMFLEINTLTIDKDNSLKAWPGRRFWKDRGIETIDRKVRAILGENWRRFHLFIAMRSGQISANFTQSYLSLIHLKSIQRKDVQKSPEFSTITILLLHYPQIRRISSWLSRETASRLFRTISQITCLFTSRSLSHSTFILQWSFFFMKKIQLTFRHISLGCARESLHFWRLPKSLQVKDESTNLSGSKQWGVLSSKSRLEGYEIWGLWDRLDGQVNFRHRVWNFSLMNMPFPWFYDHCLGSYRVAENCFYDSCLRYQKYFMSALSWCKHFHFRWQENNSVIPLIQALLETYSINIMMKNAFLSKEFLSWVVALQ